MILKGQLPSRVREWGFSLSDAGQHPSSFRVDEGISTLLSSSEGVSKNRGQVAHVSGLSFHFRKTIFRSFGGSSSHTSLPNNCAEGQHDRPSGDSLWPCCEFVPPWQVVVAAIRFVSAGALLCWAERPLSATFLAFFFEFWEAACSCRPTNTMTPKITAQAAIGQVSWSNLLSIITKS
jgi:hypothetical protein